jgi:hypothetical protein
MVLHILTAVTRPENLPKLAESLIPAATAGVEFAWHLGYDLERRHVAGQAVKNRLLDRISPGRDWVWILDDDNTAHPEFFRRLTETVAANPDLRLIACTQTVPSGWCRTIDPESLKACRIDAAQAVIRRDAIGDHRLREVYAGDSHWIEAIAKTLQPDQIGYIHEPVVRYNWLRPAQP